MPKISETVINFEVYEDSVAYLGIASVTMPDISSLTNTISGAGIAGNVESVTLGHIDAMSMSLSFRTVTTDAIKLTEARRHTLDLRVAQQFTNTTSGVVDVDTIKHIVVVTPKKLGLGNLKPASTADVSGEYAVSYLATYINGRKVTEIDPLNYICIINGKDSLASVRTALGK